MRICVFCASSLKIDQRYLDLAGEVGAELARRGHELVSGGGNISCMGAVARAAREGGARTVGIIPQQLVDLEVADTDSDELIVTPDVRSRKAEMDRLSDAFLVLPGGIGTLEELFEVWTARTLGLHSKALVILDPFGVYEPLRALMEHLHGEGFTRTVVVDAVSWATGVPHALDLVEKSGSSITPHPEEILESDP